LNGPLIVQSDKTLLLEVDHEQADDCRRVIAPFAELERAPEHIHTYRITPLGLWNARAAGHDAEQVVDALVTYSRYPVPHALLVDIAETMDRYGRLTLSKHPVHGLVLTTTDRPVLEEVLKSKRIAPLVGTRIDADSVAVHPSERGQIKQTLLKLGWPAEDLAGYIDGEAHPIDLHEDGWHLRPYQKQAVENFWHGGSGVVVLPCGAGKTLVGAGAMAEAKSTTLILVTNTVSARQWKSELVRRTSLTEDEIGEYSGTKKEIRPVTIATYQVLTTRRKGVYPHLELFDSRDWGLILYDEVHLLPAPVFKAGVRRLLADRAQAVRRAVEGDRGAGLHRTRRLRRGPGEPDRLRAAGVRDRRDGGEVPVLRDHGHQAEGDRGAGPEVRRAADPGDRAVHRPARRAGRAPRRAGHQGRDQQRAAGEAVRRVPQR
jgi:DNA excision repair protein ERCC-3